MQLLTGPTTTTVVLLYLVVIDSSSKISVPDIFRLYDMMPETLYTF